MFATFRVVTRIEARAVTAPDPWLQSAGFWCLRRQEYSAGLICSELWMRS
jgi:hypothetical protein